VVEDAGWGQSQPAAGGCVTGDAEYMRGANKSASRSILFLVVVSSIVLAGCVGDQVSRYRREPEQAAQQAEPTPFTIQLPALPVFPTVEVAAALPTPAPDIAPAAAQFVQPVVLATPEPVPIDIEQAVESLYQYSSEAHESVQPCALNPRDDYEWARACPGVRR
jgi:hypothetical protein